MKLHRTIRALIVAALLAALVFAALAIFADARQVAAALAGFPLPALAAMVALTMGCYLVRAVRWWYLMRLMGHPMSPGDATYVQLSGMTMTVTPGKVGEVIKGYLAREFAGLPMASGVTLVFCERLADVIAVVALSTGAIGAFSDSAPALAVAGAVLVLGIAVLTSERLHRVVLDVAMRRPWMKSHGGSVATVSDTVLTTLRLRPLAVSTVLSALAWSLEGVAFAVCIQALGFDGLSMPVSVAVYAIATLVGAFTFLPGGIGLTEASMVGLLIASGMASADASAATLLIRIVTMWFGIALGWAVFASRPRIVRSLLTGEATPL